MRIVLDTVAAGEPLTLPRDVQAFVGLYERHIAPRRGRASADARRLLNDANSSHRPCHARATRRGCHPRVAGDACSPKSVSALQALPLTTRHIPAASQLSFNAGAKRARSRKLAAVQRQIVRARARQRQLPLPVVIRKASWAGDPLPRLHVGLEASLLKQGGMSTVHHASAYNLAPVGLQTGCPVPRHSRPALRPCARRTELAAVQRTSRQL